MFQGLRTGGLFYVLEKGDELKLKIGHVVNVSNPQPKYNQMATIPSYNNQPEMVVDVKVKIGDETIDFKQLNANMNIANSGNVVVSDNKEAMSAEVEGLLRTSRQIVESVPYHEKVILSCDAMLRELNPQFAKEKEQEEKIGMLETKMGNIEGTLNDMMGMLSKALSKNTPSKFKEE